MGTMPRLKLVIRGLKKEQAGLPKKTRLPITPAILRQVRQKWESHGAEWDYIMLWAVMSLCFFGFLWSGKVVVPLDSSYDPGQHLSFGDIAVDNQANPSYLRVSLKQKEWSEDHNRMCRGPSMSSGSKAGIHGSQGTRRGPALPVPEWPYFNMTLTCCQAQRGAARSSPSS